MIRRLLLIASIPAAALAQAAPAPAPAPEIFLREPANGATVNKTFTVVFGLRNYGVAPAGINLKGTGHFHIIVDAAPPAVGAIIPQDSLNRHYGTGIIETKLTLSPGVHTLRVVLGDFEHKVIGPELISAPVRIIVK